MPAVSFAFMVWNSLLTTLFMTDRYFSVLPGRSSKPLYLVNLSLLIFLNHGSLGVILMVLMIAYILTYLLMYCVKSALYDENSMEQGLYLILYCF